MKNDGNPRREDTLKKTHKKEIKLFDNLLMNPVFEDDVASFRKRFNIPRNGFANHDNAEKWIKENQKHTRKVKVLHEIVGLDYKDKPKIEKQYHTYQEKPIYVYEIYKILQKHNLSAEWEPYISNYLIQNNKPVKMNTHDVRLYRESYQEKKMPIILRENIHLEIGATMSIIRLSTRFLGETIWNNVIESLQQLMQGYKEKGERPKSSNTKLQRKIYDERQAGKTDGDIYNELSEKEVKNISTVRKHLQRFKEKTKANE